MREAGGKKRVGLQRGTRRPEVDEYVHYLDCVMVSHIYRYVKMYQIIPFIYVHRNVCQLYFNTAIIRKRNYSVDH